MDAPAGRCPAARATNEAGATPNRAPACARPVPLTGSRTLALTLIEAGGQHDLADGRPAEAVWGVWASGRAPPRGVGDGRRLEPGPGTEGATGGVAGPGAQIMPKEGDGDEPDKQGHMLVVAGCDGFATELADWGAIPRARTNRVAYTRSVY